MPIKNPNQQLNFIRKIPLIKVYENEEDELTPLYFAGDPDDFTKLIKTVNPTALFIDDHAYKLIGSDDGLQGIAVYIVIDNILVSGEAALINKVNHDLPFITSVNLVEYTDDTVCYGLMID